MNAALLEVSPAELAQVLRLPPSTLVTGCLFEPVLGLVVMRVEGPGLPACDDEDEPPRIDLADPALLSRSASAGEESRCGKDGAAPPANAGQERDPARCSSACAQGGRGSPGHWLGRMVARGRAWVAGR